jgi:hypothetical protein
MSTHESQLSILDLLPPRTRRADPVSSRRAESELRHSGTLTGQQTITIQLVTQYPGKNPHELELLGTLNHTQLCRRLPECGLFQIQCGTFDSQWWPACDCGPWCEHIQAERLCREYKRIRVTDPKRRKSEYRWIEGRAELQVSDVPKATKDRSVVRAVSDAVQESK